MSTIIVDISKPYFLLVSIPQARHEHVAEKTAYIRLSAIGKEFDVNFDCQLLILGFSYLLKQLQNYHRFLFI